MVAPAILPSSSQIVVSTDPVEFEVQFDTSAGTFNVLVTRSWSPHGADRFYELVQSEYYDDAPFFRMVEGFVVQFGLSSNPAKTRVWMSKDIKDDPVKES